MSKRLARIERELKAAPTTTKTEVDDIPKVCGQCRVLGIGGMLWSVILCPLHASASELLEALKLAKRELDKDGLGDELIDKAIIQAEGGKHGLCKGW